MGFRRGAALDLHVPFFSPLPSLFLSHGLVSLSLPLPSPSPCSLTVVCVYVDVVLCFCLVFFLLFDRFRWILWGGLEKSERKKRVSEESEKREKDESKKTKQNKKQNHQETRVKPKHQLEKVRKCLRKGGSCRLEKIRRTTRQPRKVKEKKKK